MRIPPSEITGMAALRAQIDAIDQDLIGLLAERESHIDRAVVLKAAEGISAAAPSRTAEVLAKLSARATEAGFSPGLAWRMWTEMIGHYIACEQAHIGKGGQDR